MKIQCDACERAPATVICCADEAALCRRCDIEIHAANKLASKHQRLLLDSLSNHRLPPCDICREKPAFIFCVEDRALFCQDCDEPIHSASTLSSNHQRFLATGIRVALRSRCNKDTGKVQSQPPSHSSQLVKALQPHPSSVSASQWGIEDLLQLSDFNSSDKKEHVEFGELGWLAEMGLFEDHIAQEAAQVPQLPISQPSSLCTSYKTSKLNMSHKKPRTEIPDDDDEEHFTVPDLG